MSLRVALAAFLLAPLLAQASLVIDANVACSGDLDIRSFTHDTPDLLGCSGNLNLTQGQLTSDHALLIQASGDLWVSAVQITASSLTLIAGTSLSLLDDVTLNVGDQGAWPNTQDWAASTVRSASGATIMLSHGTEVVLVPEPGTWQLAGCGLALALTALGLKRRRG